jgi:hypothetical protein
MKGIEMKIKSLAVAGMIVCSSGGMASALIVDELMGTTSAPFVASSALATSSSAGSTASSASTAIVQQKKQSYLAAAMPAANFVRMEGDYDVSTILREVMETEKQIVARVRGPKVAARLNDMHLAQMVVWRVAELTQ